MTETQRRGVNSNLVSISQPPMAVYEETSLDTSGVVLDGVCGSLNGAYFVCLKRENEGKAPIQGKKTLENQALEIPCSPFPNFPEPDFEKPQSIFIAISGGNQ